ncbi:valine--tRNA ligase [Candidatus Amesbacteria bacterium RIFCSPHIGHO2_12_FULL_48_14]|uniref:Valine--tRNA ligase n=2 Tax=Candidatus Amesiibacteriota TaxID=1752730 RepID=A0A1F4Z522_9BACT|nr:MAG: Valine-tRNA ligase [Candidatus Amesbacteria bacterium GW2011_GWC1_48_10]OGD01107.1 MAG: valine--tRNA ligase [Candidatus Amesbacteria bacterium RIFCSPHIGHO2_12_FULL_48_14]
MDKVYDHSKYETEIYKMWEESGVFRAGKTGKPFTVLMPPPNANASLHAGHAMYTIDDIMVRWKRMQGFSAVWIPGMDHAGFETQFVYEKELAKSGKSRMNFDRNTLYGNIYKFVRDNSGLIYQQFKRLGFSADWDRSVFTLDPHVLKQIFETFKQMEAEGKVYRDDYIVNFCTHCGTSLSELETDHKEREDKLYYIRYGQLVVATVRPETMFGDTAVAVNPKDKRYKNLAGKKVKLPLTSREIPIITDEMVDMEFGTGAVKITPAHDPNDFTTGQRYNLERISVIDLNGKMRLPSDVKYREVEGKKVNDAREMTIKKLQESGFLEKTVDYRHTVTVCYKCGHDLEPTITPNWFIRVTELKKPVIEAVEKDEVKFFPKRYKKQMLQWLEVMHDWPISRQIVWGIRIPVWYEIEIEKQNLHVWWLDEEKKLQQGPVSRFLKQGTPLPKIETGLQKVLAETGAEAPRYVVAEEMPKDGKIYLPETDTFDTWFSSGLWPLVTLKEDEFETRLPTDFIGTLSDILPFWISRMIMFSLHVKNKVPYRDVYLWSMVADAKGVKMSKSKGNVVNPIDLVDKYGADSLRMALVYGVAPGSKIPLSEEKVKGMRNFANKIWNAARFVATTFEGEMTAEIQNPEIKNRVERIEKETTKSMEKYQFGRAAELLWEEFWHWFCDKCIEESKIGKISKADVVHLLIRFLKLLHPFMPFVTEAVWGEIKHLRKYPEEMLISSRWPH